MTSRPDIVAAYDRLEQAAGGLAKIPGDGFIPDLKPLIQKAADECGMTFEDARAALKQHWAALGG